MQQAELIVKSGPHAGHRIPLPGSRCIIGRERDCHFRPEDDLISRHHCVIRSDGITYRVRDLGSRNGTFVNGHAVHGDVVLVPDDELMIGGMVLQLTVPLPPSQTPSGGETLGQTDIIDGTTVSNIGGSNSSSRFSPDNDTKKSFKLPDKAPTRQNNPLESD